MSAKSYPYTMAHLHTVELLEEISKLEDAPPQAILLLANVASMLSRKVQETA